MNARVAVLGGALAAAAALAPEAHAQNLGPGLHWGALAYPEIEPARQFGYQIFLFSEFGQPGDGRYSEAYQSTIGLNLLTVSSTRDLARNVANPNTLLFRSTLVAGASYDPIPRALQNHFIHRCGGLAALRCRNGQIPYVPRGQTRTSPEFGYSGELTARVLSLGRSELGEPRLFASRLFISGGFWLSTIDNELYAQLGLYRFPLIVGRMRDWRSCIYFYLSGMARAGAAIGGVPVPWRGPAFEDVASEYLTSQGSLGVVLFESVFPVGLEVGITGSTGLFVDGTGRGIPEKLISIRLEVGDLVFETFNDLINDKDMGPTFGVRAFYNASPGGRLYRWFSWL
jgi:hypothetical protein